MGVILAEPTTISTTNNWADSVDDESKYQFECYFNFISDEMPSDDVKGKGKSMLISYLGCTHKCQSLTSPREGLSKGLCVFTTFQPDASLIEKVRGPEIVVQYQAQDTDAGVCGGGVDIDAIEIFHNQQFEHNLRGD